MTPHDQQRETSLDKRRGHRPRLIAPSVGRWPVLTLPDRLLATILHQRLALPQTAIAALSGVRPETVNKRIRDIRQLLDQAGYTIQPGRTGSPAWKTSPIWPPPKASSPRQRQRVNDLQALAWRVRSMPVGGGGAPGREPYGGAGAAADVDHPVGGRQLRGIGDGTHPRAVPAVIHSAVMTW